KKTEERFRKQNEFLTRMLESIPYPFFVVDVRDYTIKIANSAAKSGTISKESTCYALIHNRSMPCNDMEYTCPLKEVKKIKKPVITEHIHHDGRGNATNVEVHAYPILDEEGNVSEVITNAFDITKRKRLEEELRFSDAALMPRTTATKCEAWVTNTH
ncbi:MAG: PAS domain-containing protein, partial [Desulfobacteraceae bacterium]|nr:PAS domain-containing protein [Desulfobacteraceae bacterium]